MSMRSEIKKLLVVALCASLFTCFAVGCGGGSKESSKDSSKASSTTSSTVSKDESKTESKTESKAEESSKTESKAEESSKEEESKTEESSKEEESKTEESSKEEESKTEESSETEESQSEEPVTVANLVGVTEDNIDEAYAAQDASATYELVYVTFKDNTALVVIGEAEADQPANVIYGKYTVANLVQTEEGVAGEMTVTDANGKEYKANVASTPSSFTFILVEDELEFNGVQIDNASAVQAVEKVVSKLNEANTEEPAEEEPAEEGGEEAGEEEEEDAAEE